MIFNQRLEESVDNPFVSVFNTGLCCEAFAENDAAKQAVRALAPHILRAKTSIRPERCRSTYDVRTYGCDEVLVTDSDFTGFYFVRLPNTSFSVQQEQAK